MSFPDTAPLQVVKIHSAENKWVTQSEWVIKVNGLSQTSDSEVHIIHISHVEEKNISHITWSNMTANDVVMTKARVLNQCEDAALPG